MKFVKGIFLSMVFSMIPVIVSAGSLDDPASPDDPVSAMYTLEDIYNRLDTGAAGAKRTEFEEPSSGPTAGTGHTLDEIMGKAPAVDDADGADVSDVASGKTFWGLKSGAWGLKTGTGTIATDPAPVPKTGQTTSYAAGDDGNLGEGVAWPDPRFMDNGDGTVTDNLTGLIWLKDGGCMGARAWGDSSGETFAVISQFNEGVDFACGQYTAGTYTDWRLPNFRELLSLMDFGQENPALPSGHLFTSVKNDSYFSSTTRVDDAGRAWGVHIYQSYLINKDKTTTAYVWPVRGGQ
ncbi:MAG: DUF1566 domain-containing protein [Deltaproteobacteria bacterium]|nr:DUF1566 domain-containing protein [Deltaproteobacteria bacterium]